MEKEIENAINSVLVISNPQSMHLAVKKIMNIVVGRSEHLTCRRCKSTNILNSDKDNDAQCIECAFIWAG